MTRNLEKFLDLFFKDTSPAPRQTHRKIAGVHSIQLERQVRAPRQAAATGPRWCARERGAPTPRLLGTRARLVREPWGPRPLRPRRHRLAVADPSIPRARARVGGGAGRTAASAVPPAGTRRTVGDGGWLACVQDACSTGAGMGEQRAARRPGRPRRLPLAFPVGIAHGSRVPPVHGRTPPSRPAGAAGLLLARPGGQGGRLAHTPRRSQPSLLPSFTLPVSSSADCCSSDRPRLFLLCHLPECQRS